MNRRRGTNNPNANAVQSSGEKGNKSMVKTSPLFMKADNDPPSEESIELLSLKHEGEEKQCCDENDDSEQQKHDRLGDRVVDCVKRSPNLTIRPAALAHELGISIDDASAELCGLLAAVGGGESGAYFKFEEIITSSDPSHDDTNKTYPSLSSSPNSVTMVFTFPPNFERKCKAYRVKGEIKETILNIMFLLFKIARALISFGLILSIAVISVAAVIALLVATIAYATGQGGNRQGGNHRHFLGVGTRHMHQLVNAGRQILMMYVLFGNDNDQGGYHQWARDALTASFWMGHGINPCWNPWFWIRASEMSRRSRMGRGWSRHTSQTNSTRAPPIFTSVASQPNTENVRGALFIIMEFLFGPDDQWESNPTAAERWRMRALVITTRGGKVSLQELLPYVDNPPRSISETAEAVWIISHFNGRPSAEDCSGGETTKCYTFCFPELMIDSEKNSSSASLRQTNYETIEDEKIITANEECSWESIFFSSNDNTGDVELSESCLPRCLVERTRVLTKLTKEQFFACVVAAIANYFGVQWFQTYTANGSILSKKYVPRFVVQLLKSFASFLSVYSKLFFLLFVGRLLIMMARNIFIWKRNQRRQKLAEDVKQMNASKNTCHLVSAPRGEDI